MAVSASEAEKLTELRKRVGALPEDLVVAGDEPATLRRFLVARKWDVDKAQEQLQRTLDWRAKEFGVAAFLAKPPLKRLALVRSLLPANPHLGFSKDGWPVTLLSLGASDPSAVARDLQGEDLVADLVVRAEFFRAVVFPEASARTGRLIDKEVVLIDFGGMSLGLLKLKPVFSIVNKTGSTFFPERTVHFFVLNAPRAFAAIWTILKGLVDPRTQQKVHILSGGKRQLAALRKFMDDSVIPETYGGSRPPPTLAGTGEEETKLIYARLDAWLAEQGVALLVRAPTSAPAPPAAAVTQQEASPPEPAVKSIEPTQPAAPSPPTRTVKQRPALLRLFELLTLLLLWLLSSLTLATLLWAHIPAGKP